MRAYCDDRAAALALAATLQHENALLRAENDHLRELVDPSLSRWRGAVAQVSSAVAVTVLLLGAMFGAGVIVEQTASAAAANVTRDGDLSARLAQVSPCEVVEALAPVAAVAPVAARVDGLPAQVIVRSRHHGRHHHRVRHHRRHRDQG